MSGGHRDMPMPRHASRVKRVALPLLGAILLLAQPLPAPEPVSSEGAVVTVSVTVLPNPIEVTVRTPPRVRAGVPFPVLAFIENCSESRIEAAVATIHTPDSVEVIVVGRGVDLGTIPANGANTAVWLVRALTEGNYVLLVSISGIYDGDVVTAQDAVLVPVRDR